MSDPIISEHALPEWSDDALLAVLEIRGRVCAWREQFVQDGYGEARLEHLGEVSEPYWKRCYITDWTRE